MGDVCWDERPEKEGWLVKLIGDHNASFEALPGARKSKRGRKGDVKRRAMEKGRYVMVIAGEKK